MKTVLQFVLLFALSIAPVLADESAARIAELDAYWIEVSRAVKAGDFDGYKATCHSEGVLVSGKSESSYPLSTALAKWKQGFADTKAGKISASVTFRFNQRFGDESTAHETGMFLYSSTTEEGDIEHAYIHFEALLVKKSDGWKIIMEYQKSEGTAEEWKALAKS